MTDEIINIKIYQIINSPIAVTTSDAKKVFEILKTHILNNETVQLDFDGVTSITTAFLNVAIGALYTVADGETLNRLVKLNPNTIRPIQLRKIFAVIENAKSKKLGMKD
ncbi:STAS-like domain-containing protein [Leuconostoc lactis]|uniref:STAS-like domain-containing protein n=1 Tax=Leuconostoc lactis TaxID=1246 RepID=UPI00241C6943|nr:STAS-like domain-containing protein [Leuconostoc lactis]